MEDPEIVLAYMSGPQDGETLKVRPNDATGEVDFGRIAPCLAIILGDPEVSRRHAKIFWKDNSWWLSDLGSSNGTFIGEFERTKKVFEPEKLVYGQIFRIGRTKFCLEVDREKDKKAQTAIMNATT